MKFLSLDLEMNQPSGSIIQIGACIGNLLTGEVLDTFNQLVKLENEELSNFITQLTGIDEWDLAIDGTPLPEAYQSLLEFHDKHTDIECNPITWGGGDSQELHKQVLSKSPQVANWPFGRRWLDVKTVFQFQQIAKGKKAQAGLAKALVKSGMQFKGRKHNALDDSINTFLLAHRLLTP